MQKKTIAAIGFCCALLGGGNVVQAGDSGFTGAHWVDRHGYIIPVVSSFSNSGQTNSSGQATLWVLNDGVVWQTFSASVANAYTLPFNPFGAAVFYSDANCTQNPAIAAPLPDPNFAFGLVPDFISEDFGIEGVFSAYYALPVTGVTPVTMTINSAALGPGQCAPEIPQTASVVPVSQLRAVSRPASLFDAPAHAVFIRP
jgi:hypothetical protein